MRVVTGEAKGRKLKAPKTMGTRPIIDRVKTALFDILSTEVEDVRFLDLFGGTGSVGIEALSRGATSATFIEMNYKVLKLLRENLQITQLADRAETIHGDAFKFLQAHSGTNATRPQSDATHEHPSVGTDLSRPLTDVSRPGAVGQRVYDIIYVAPPQYHEMAAQALQLLDGSALVAPEGLVIVQIHPKERASVAAVQCTHLHLDDERRYGSTLLMFYRQDSRTEHSKDGDTVQEA